ncbi:hypothetical protein LSTR_LSTR011460 [Laodelphax striatellus]|uniref:Uncharacterized protein n=1 Tax=Laodelphax striatellus TaxID=195883 RepID=A0A482WH38_LAOST|nr:hypothetical protein LSTR_LSTR011460 [Laodelphax striatellus]
MMGELKDVRSDVRIPGDTLAQLRVLPGMNERRVDTLAQLEEFRIGRSKEPNCWAPSPHIEIRVNKEVSEGGRLLLKDLHLMFQNK